MVAFTQLCQKVNISFFDNTITLYPNTHKVSYESKVFEVEYDEVATTIDEIKKFENSIKGVARKDPDHHLYHKYDDFNEELTHYHIKFPETIDQIKLEQILAISVDNELISKEERESILNTYKVVSENLTLRPAQLNVTTETKPEPEYRISPEKNPLPSANPSNSWDIDLKDLKQRVVALRVNNEDQRKFLNGLHTMVSKGIDLENKSKTNNSFQKDSSAVKTMCNSLFKAYVDANTQKIDGDTFKKSCGMAIAEARNTLDYDWFNEFFSKITHAVFSLGSDVDKDQGTFNKKELVEEMNNVQSAADEIKFNPK
jgi:hypothetical protein